MAKRPYTSSWTFSQRTHRSASTLQRHLFWTEHDQTWRTLIIGHLWIQLCVKVKRKVYKPSPNSISFSLREKKSLTWTQQEAYTNGLLCTWRPTVAIWKSFESFYWPELTSSSVTRIINCLVTVLKETTSWRSSLRWPSSPGRQLHTTRMLSITSSNSFGAWRCVNQKRT